MYENCSECKGVRGNPVGQVSSWFHGSLVWRTLSKASVRVNGGDEDPDEEDDVDAVAGRETCPGFEKMKCESEAGYA